MIHRQVETPQPVSDPGASTERLDLRMPAEPASVGTLRRAAMDFAERNGLADPGPVGLAVSEAVTNTVVHAYRDTEPGEVRLVICVEAERLVVVVRDWGAGMLPRIDSPGLGLGLPMIATLAGYFDVEAVEGEGTLLRMHFPRTA